MYQLREAKGIVLETVRYNEVCVAILTDLEGTRVLLDLPFAEFEELPELDVVLDDEVA